jgi:hypothetical protein
MAIICLIMRSLSSMWCVRTVRGKAQAVAGWRRATRSRRLTSPRGGVHNRAHAVARRVNARTGFRAAASEDRKPLHTLPLILDRQ